MAESPVYESPIIAILGPTAVGKTELAISIAERINAEIISADSRQIYKQLNVGTATPSASELERVPHHFINELNIGDPFSAGQFATEAADRMESIIANGKQPLVVGGSTLYVEALLHGLSDIPTTSVETRTALMERLELKGPIVLFEELTSVDPISAATMDATKTQRVVRALEVYHDTGRPLSWYHARTPSPKFSYLPIVVNRPREMLYDRINNRVDTMLDLGLVEENRRLMNDSDNIEYNPLKTIGYREPMAYLRGEISYEQMVLMVKQNSRRYAKRQITWFRRRNDYRWIDVEINEKDSIVDNIVSFLFEDK